MKIDYNKLEDRIEKSIKSTTYHLVNVSLELTHLGFDKDGRSYPKDKDADFENDDIMEIKAYMEFNSQIDQDLNYRSFPHIYGKLCNIMNNELGLFFISSTIESGPMWVPINEDYGSNVVMFKAGFGYDAIE